MKTLFIETHCSKNFTIGYWNDNEFLSEKGNDAATEIIFLIEKLTKKNFEQIIFLKGPGSLTGLKIGGSHALGLSIGLSVGLKTPVYALSLYDLIFAKYPECIFYFYTGTKKWVVKTLQSEKIQEIAAIEENLEQNNLSRTLKWISNEPSKLDFLNQEQKIEYPSIIHLMHEFQNLKSENLDLIYPVTLF